MRLRHISIFFIVGIALINLFSSCKDSETESISTTLSADAQIYSFSARSIPRTASDTLNYPYLAKVKFAIDQANHIIYNVDSLPCGFTMRKIAASISFSSSTPTATQVVYSSDSIIDWTAATDSIDFMIYPKREPALNGVPQVKFKVTAQNGTAPYEYTIKLLIRKVDQDSITWRKEQNLPLAGANKVVLADNVFYSYINNSGTLALYKSNRSSINWQNVALSGLPAAALKSVVEKEGLFYATDGTNVLKSTDGASWSPAFAYTGQIVGVLPALDGSDPRLVLVKQSGSNAELDYANENVNGIEKTITVSDRFPLEGYSVAFDESVKGLVVTGGKKASGTWSNSTWLIQYRDKELTISPENSKLVPFAAGEGTVTFMYDKKLYAWGKDDKTAKWTLYTSDSGLNWVPAKSKQYFAPTAHVVIGQTILVDGDNYIWTFGGLLTSTTFSSEVWRGRMNGFNK